MARKVKKRRFTTGEINACIDSLLHPWFNDYPALIVVDGLLHGIAEGDPAKSIQKFLKYGVPKLIERARR